MMMMMQEEEELVLPKLTSVDLLSRRKEGRDDGWMDG
jgi:hypothetical protein